MFLSRSGKGAVGSPVMGFHNAVEREKKGGGVNSRSSEACNTKKKVLKKHTFIGGKKSGR